MTSEREALIALVGALRHAIETNRRRASKPDGAEPTWREDLQLWQLLGAGITVDELGPVLDALIDGEMLLAVPEEHFPANPVMEGVLARAVAFLHVLWRATKTQGPEGWQVTLTIAQLMELGALCAEARKVLKGAREERTGPALDDEEVPHDAKGTRGF